MARRKVTAGITSVTVPIFVQDSSSATGAGLGSLTSASSGLAAEYRRQGQSAWTAITLSAGTLGTYSSGGWVADGSLAGAYEVGIPDAALAAGAKWSQVRFYGAANMLPVLLEFELDAINYQDSARAGLTALPSSGTLAVKPAVTLAAADVSGNLPADIQTVKTQAVTCAAGVTVLPNVGTSTAAPVVDASGRVQVQYGTSAGQLSASAGVLAVNVTQFGGAAGTFASGVPSVNAAQWGGTAVASASVRSNVIQWNSSAVATPNAAGYPLVDVAKVAGSAASLVAGAVEANVTEILGAAVTETVAGNVAGNASTFFDNAGAATTKTVDDVGSGAGGAADWTATEKSQIRYRLGIDGTESTPVTNLDLNLGTVDADVSKWGGNAVPATSVSGVPKVDLAYVNGVSATAGGTVNANVTEWNSSAVQNPEPPTAPAVATAVAGKFGQPITVTGTPTTTAFDASVSGSGLIAGGGYEGMFCKFDDGSANDSVTRKISTVSVVGDTITFHFGGATGASDGPWPATPSAGDTALILGHA